MSKTLSSEFLLGHVIALTYAVNSCIKHHPKEQSVLNEIATQLNALSISVLEKGAKDTADGVERIRMALISRCRADAVSHLHAASRSDFEIKGAGGIEDASASSGQIRCQSSGRRSRRQEIPRCSATGASRMSLSLGIPPVRHA